MRKICVPDPALDMAVPNEQALLVDKQSPPPFGDAKSIVVPEDSEPDDTDLGPIVVKELEDDVTV
jgi:hypothetical protein